MFKKRKFNGNNLQDITDKLELLSACSRQYELSLREKADFVVHMFDSSARVFLFENCKEEGTYEETVSVSLAYYVD